MTLYRVDDAQVRDVETGGLLAALVGRPVQIVLRDTTTPATILDETGGQIPGSTLTVTPVYTVPRFWIETEDAAGLYLDWLDPASGVRGGVQFEAVLRDATLIAQDAASEAAVSAAISAEAAEASATGPTRDMVDEVVAEQLPLAVGTVLAPMVADAVPPAVDSAVASALPPAVDEAVGPAVAAAVPPAVASAVPPAVDSAVAPAVAAAVPPAVDSAVPPAVDSAVAALPKSPPTGAIMMFGAVAAPTGWLACDGAAVSRATYANLFAVIGTTYGIGDGSTTFNLPSFNDRNPMGTSGTKAVGTTGGSTTHSHTLSPAGYAKLRIAAGSSAIMVDNVNPGPAVTYNQKYTLTTAPITEANSSITATALGGATDSGTALPPYLALTFIIRT